MDSIVPFLLLLCFTLQQKDLLCVSMHACGWMDGQVEGFVYKLCVKATLLSWIHKRMIVIMMVVVMMVRRRSGLEWWWFRRPRERVDVKLMGWFCSFLLLQSVQVSTILPYFILYVQESEEGAMTWWPITKNSFFREKDCSMGR